jgi:hypothetical protein
MTQHATTMPQYADKLDASAFGLAVARRLMDETGITEAQAHDLIRMLGHNWSSLVREARSLHLDYGS